MECRREFALPAEDEVFLDGYGRPWETVVDGSQWVLIHEFSSQHAGYNVPSVTVAIRIETGYPMAPLDMVYVLPHLSRQDGQVLLAADAQQAIQGSVYQRWSRHYTGANPWVVGTDGLERHILSIEDWFRREFSTCT